MDRTQAARVLEALTALYPDAALTALPRTDALRRRIDALRFRVDDLRAFYVSLRQGQRPDAADPRQQAMLRVLQSMGLIGPQCQLLPVRKTDPLNDPLYRLIQGCET